MKIVLVTLLLIGLSTVDLCSQSQRKGFDISGFAGMLSLESFDEVNNKLERSNEPYLGAKLGYNFNSQFAMEGTFGYSRSSAFCPGTVSDCNLFVYKANLIYYYSLLFPRRFIPYVSGGIGAFSRTGGGQEGISELAFDFGGGAKVFLNDRVSLRFEVRDILFSNDRFIPSGLESEVIDNIEFSGSLTVLLSSGGFKDSDNDGIPDRVDRCPATPDAAFVDASGCPSDSDRDGVFDVIDRCSNTPKETGVDSFGCSQDYFTGDTTRQPDGTNIGSGSTGQLSLSPGDVVRILIWRQKELSGDYTVDENGVVGLPLIGTVRVTGLSTENLKSLLISKYRQYLKDPNISVTPLFRINVMGEVRRPGLYPVDATISLSDLIAIAGGVTGAGDPKKIKVVRNGRVVQQNLGESFSQGEQIRKIGIRSGDQVIVEKKGGFSAKDIGVITSLISTIGLIVTLITR